MSALLAQSPCPGPMQRREWLRVGSLSLGALASGLMPSLARLSATEKVSSDFSVILFWAHGGPSHLETFDLKPNAPAEYRGPFRPIRTSVPGIDICEHVPKLARLADKFTLIRSLRHERAEHSGGTHRFLTGHASLAANLQNSENPEIGSIVARHLESTQKDIPLYAGDSQVYGGGPAYLGKRYAAFMPYANNPISASGNNTYDPIPIYHPGDGRAGVKLTADSAFALQQRADLLDQLDRFRSDVDRSGAMDAWDRSHRRAVEILCSRRTRDAFDLSLEPKSSRERYGDTHWGKSLLTCRRLVEAGVRFVQCQATFRLPESVGRTSSWDDHSVNANIFDAYKERLPVIDQVVSTLIDDLFARGMNRHVLFIFCGEFGRTPRIAYQDPSRRPGRDHWPKAMSVFLSGGGLRMGQVIGATNPRGEEPAVRGMDSNCLLATIYERFGINPADTIPDRTGRPVAILPHGEAIRELL